MTIGQDACVAGDEREARVSHKRRGLIAGAAALVVAALAKQAPEQVGAQGEALIVGNNISGGTQRATATTWMSSDVAASPGLRIDNNIYNPNNPNNPYGTYPFDAKADGIQGFTVNPNPNPNVISFAGVFGRNNDPSGVGIWGEAPNGTGAFGDSSSGSGVAGSSSSAAGVYGISTSAQGVYGLSTSGNGVYGQSATGYGVLGLVTSSSSFGAMAGVSTNSGVAAFAGGNTVAGGFAAIFNGTVQVNGAFVVTDMTMKHGLIKNQATGESHLMYTVEAPESWAEDFGTGQLVNGKAVVKIDPEFVPLVQTDSDYHVFITSHGDTNGLHVTNKAASSFSVEENKGGTSTVSFSWRLVAKPRSTNKVERLGKYTPKELKLPTAKELAVLTTPPALPKRKP